MAAEQCCICLDAIGIEVCDICSGHVCQYCWHAYKLQKSGATLPCPICRSECVTGVRTRSSTFSDRQTQLIASMRQMLYDVDALLILTPEKGRLIHTIFKTLCRHKGSDIDLLKNQNFREACRQKLIRFYYRDGFEGAAGYYTRLFDEPIR